MRSMNVEMNQAVYNVAELGGGFRRSGLPDMYNNRLRSKFYETIGLPFD